MSYDYTRYTKYAIVCKKKPIAIIMKFPEILEIYLKCTFFGTTKK